MFNFFRSPEKKARQNAANWLEVANRVYHFRRDVLTPTQSEKLQTAKGNVLDRLKENAPAEKITASVDSLEGVLRTTGGKIYPASSLVENVEFFLVAAIVILGLRAYFIQPFKIPTNSMWPTYYGMTAEMHPPGSPELSPIKKALRFATLGATSYSVTAPADGEVMIPILRGRLAVSEKTARSLFIFPTTVQEFTFLVGDKLTTLTLPDEFDGAGNWLRDTFFPGHPESFYAALSAISQQAGPLQHSTLALQNGGQLREEEVLWIPLGKFVHQGEKMISFDILTGDLLFVDRLSYNFVRPRVGSGFVFKTENIHSPQMLDRRTGAQIRQYYVKRLVGLPGDRLEIKPPALWRNDQPIEGSAAFGKNARREGIYPGYTNIGMLDAGEVVNVPEKNFFALGDNSPDSSDSRAWGFVPELEVVGRPLFIYFPLTSRWGPTR